MWRCRSTRLEATHSFRIDPPHRFAAGRIIPGLPKNRCPTKCRAASLPPMISRQPLHCLCAIASESGVKLRSFPPFCAASLFPHHPDQVGSCSVRANSRTPAKAGVQMAQSNAAWPPAFAGDRKLTCLKTIYADRVRGDEGGGPVPALPASLFQCEVAQFSDLFQNCASDRHRMPQPPATRRATREFSVKFGGFPPFSDFRPSKESHHVQ